MNIEAYRLVLAVADCMGVKPEAILSRSRRSDIVEARDMASYYLREHLGFTFAEAGVVLRRHHTAILRGWVRAAERLNCDTDLMATLMDIRERMAAHQTSAQDSHNHLTAPTLSG